MMSEADRNKAADTLVAAEKARKQAVQLSKTWPDITMEDAYAISTEVANRKIAAGARLIGHKVGLTSKAMQRSSQIDEPDYGHLLDTMMIADGARVPHENYCLPRVEIELAFILGKPLKGPGIGLPDVLRATEYVVPAIEVVDARLQDPRKIFDTVSDNGAAAGIVIGGRPVGPLDVDLRWVGGIMYRNSEIEETGVAAGVLGHPALGVAWLANKLGAHGVTLEPGHLVLAGSFTRVVFARKGDTLHADFGSARRHRAAICLMQSRLFDPHSISPPFRGRGTLTARPKIFSSNGYLSFRRLPLKWGGSRRGSGAPSLADLTY